MAQTIEEIEQEIIDEKDAKADLNDLNSPSKVSIWRLWVYVFAVAAWVQQKKRDTHQEEVTDIINNQKTHSRQWYADKAKAFQWGDALVAGQDYYDNTGLTESEIADKQIVKYAAVTRVYDEENNLKGLQIKMAGIENDELVKLTDANMDAIGEYFDIVGDAGVNIYRHTGDADSLKLSLKIYYDPLVLNSDGERLDGTNDTPVRDAIDNYLKNKIEFNGLFITSKMVDEIQAVAGVVIPHVETIEATYGALAYQSIPIKYLPDSGYMRILDDNDLTVEYLPYEGV